MAPVFYLPSLVLEPPPLPATGGRLHCGRLYGAARALAIAELARQSPGLILVVAPDIATQATLEAECRFFLGSQAALLLSFPDWETLPYDLTSPHSEIISQRLQTLHRLETRKAGGLLITSAPTLLQRLCPVDHVRNQTTTLSTGDKIEIGQLRQRLDLAGYQGCSQVMAPGEFAVRGSLVDLFPMGSESPCRLDFLDDCIDSIRAFDPERQTSTAQIEHLDVLPAREFPLDPEAVERFRKNFRKTFDIDPSQSPVYRDISDAIVPIGIEYYLPLFFEQTASLFDYLPTDTTIVCWEDVDTAVAQVLGEIEIRHESRRQDVEHPPLPVPGLYLSEAQFQEALAHHPRLDLSRFEHEEQPGDSTFNYASRALPELKVRPQDQAPARALRHFLSSTDRKVLFSTHSPGRREQLKERLDALEIKVEPVASWEDFLHQKPALALTVANIEDGFELPDAGVSVIPEAHLFPDRTPQQHRQRSRRDPKTILSELANLKLGSPVVHEDYGVGRYQGLRKLEIDEVEQEFLIIQYADTDRLYVPIMELHRITRYSGADPEDAPLHSLGGDQWQKIKRRAAKRAYDAAAELLEVQARRNAQSGCELKIPSDYPKFEAAFPFDETPDQAKAIREVLDGLESSVPMDRIVCGDVGFGKTEVGMRAAFATAFNGFQVAVLTPTTLLAQQHGKTFRDRFADWPVRIEAISRFRTAREQAGILGDLAEGKLDIVIGTHRLLQDDVKFHNLGLVIIDEEQRFGVRHKERLKALRSRTNLLTLTATPIPRTLNMSLSGLRDLSIIATAPAHRHAIKTYVTQWNRQQIREACLRELKRGGQIYVLHNRVASIEEAAETMRQTIPEAEVRVAHGQMRERELEAVMRDFYRQRFNVLVCTTIIENGIDIPTANTIIINRADHFGLAQLHQLRGRVGRSHHLAYAYLTCPPLQTMTPDAKKRIEAIEAMEELGSGFMLATQDLEIRGAGELLGEEQSGQIQQIGFALYHRLLQRSVDTLKKGALPELDKPLEHGPEIDLGFQSLIPDDYLPDVYLRLTLYKRIAGAISDEELDELQVEMVDRFGPLPQAVANLFAITRLKLEITTFGFLRKIQLTRQEGRITFGEPGPEPESVIRIIEDPSDCYRLDNKMRLHFELDMPTIEDRIHAVQDLANRIGTREAA